MLQVRLHGRGGQGTVTAAELLSVAAFYEGKFAQAFPSFGSERMGAPVTSFCRLDIREIRLREPVVEPDAVLIQDATLLHAVDLFQGLRPDGYVLVNTGHRLTDLGLEDLVSRLPPTHVRTVAATELAVRHVGKALPNAGLLGAFAALTGAVNLGSIEQAVRARFQPRVADGNVAAARAAYASVKEGERC
ncbi:MAG: 2-oxoacid:acceptor oxidoreductase family protein [Polyangiaceae bacterium]|jgi:pyruvate ferredoxin oxidoreductase gamma subunit